MPDKICIAGKAIGRCFCQYCTPERETLMIPGYHQFDGMCWPIPDMRLDELEHNLRYGNSVSQGDAVMAASVIAAYREILTCTERKRRQVKAELRAEMERRTRAVTAG